MKSIKARNPQFNLRLSPELKDKIIESSKTNQRSINSEILFRIQQAFDLDGKAIPH